MLAQPIRSEYNPKFFAKDCEHNNSNPLLANNRTAAASLSKSPLAKP